MTSFKVISAAFGALMITAVAMPTSARANNWATVCFPETRTTITIIDQITGVENAVVIIRNDEGKADVNDRPVVAANNFYDKGAGAYWTWEFPAFPTLDRGCYTFFFMTKTSRPGSGEWLCNRANVGHGGSPANGPRTSTLSGQMGASVTSSFVLIPSQVYHPPFDWRSDKCPKG